MAEKTPTPDGEQRSQKIALNTRIGASVGGGVFLVLSALDAMFNPFPGTETFFAFTGAGLLGIGITGKKPPWMKGDSDTED